MTGDAVALDRDVGDLAAIDVGHKVGKRQRRLRPAGRGSLEQIEERDEKQAYDDPEGEVLAEIIHAAGLSLPPRAPRPIGAAPQASTPAKHRMLSRLNNCKARSCH